MSITIAACCAAWALPASRKLMEIDQRRQGAAQPKKTESHVPSALACTHCPGSRSMPLPIVWLWVKPNRSCTAMKNGNCDRSPKRCAGLLPKNFVRCTNTGLDAVQHGRPYSRHRTLGRRAGRRATSETRERETPDEQDCKPAGRAVQRRGEAVDGRGCRADVQGFRGRDPVRPGERRGDGCLGQGDGEGRRGDERRGDRVLEEVLRGLDGGRQGDGFLALGHRVLREAHRLREDLVRELRRPGEQAERDVRATPRRRRSRR